MTVLTGNVPKLLLATESLLFDLLYLTQRFVFYPPSADDSQTADAKPRLTQPLIPRGYFAEPDAVAGSASDLEQQRQTAAANGTAAQLPASNSASGNHSSGKRSRPVLAPGTKSINGTH